MGCFSFVCKESGLPVASDSFSGDAVRMYLLENGNVIESDNITVWDMEAKGWRSFNFSKVLEVK